MEVPTLPTDTVMLGYTLTNWRPTWVVKHGAKKSQMLTGTENTMPKAKVCMSIEIIKIIF
jgi:hypothetical protein